MVWVYQSSSESPLNNLFVWEDPISTSILWLYKNRQIESRFCYLKSVPSEDDRQTHPSDDRLKCETSVHQLELRLAIDLCVVDNYELHKSGTQSESRHWGKPGSFTHFQVAVLQTVSLSVCLLGLIFGVVHFLVFSMVNIAHWNSHQNEKRTNGGVHCLWCQPLHVDIEIYWTLLGRSPSKFLLAIKRKWKC